MVLLSIYTVCACVYRGMAAAVAKSTGCKNSYSLMKLPNHNCVLQTFPDAMHTVKDSIERVFFLLIGKCKLDKIAVLEKKLNRFGFDEQTRKRKRGGQATAVKVQHPYVLSPDDRSKAIIMTSTDFNPGQIFFRTTGMKSHDWKVVHCMCMCVCVHVSTLEDKGCVCCVHVCVCVCVYEVIIIMMIT